MNNTKMKPIDEIRMIIKSLKTDVKDIKRDVSTIKASLDVLPKADKPIEKNSSETASSGGWFFS